MTAPTSPRRTIADLDVPLADVVRDVKRLADYRAGQLAELAHLLDANDANYVHCATDQDAQVPTSDWTPGGQQ